MKALRLREDLHQVVEESDTRLLKMLYAVAKEYRNEDFTVPGKPIHSKLLKERVLAAKARIKTGRFTTQADLEKEMEQW
jgi:hypothetical protein